MASIDVDAHRRTVAAAGVVMRVVVTGSECTGKTTLAAALAEHYQTTAVGEFARQLVLEKGALPRRRDVDAIASGQIAAEIAAENVAAAGDASMLILDTDLLSTVVYARHYYGDCPAWIEDTLARRGADLYLLAGIDVPWVADGEQRDRAGRREEMQQLFRDALIARSARFVEVSGPPDDRLDAAIAAITAAAR